VIASRLPSGDKKSAGEAPADEEVGVRTVAGGRWGGSLFIQCRDNLFVPNIRKFANTKG